MFRAIIIRGGKWKDNLFTQDSLWGDFPNLEEALKWITEESGEFRGGWPVIKVTIEDLPLLLG